jgi:hypothetical protein
MFAMGSLSFIVQLGPDPFVLPPLNGSCGHLTTPELTLQENSCVNRNDPIHIAQAIVSVVGAPTCTT